MRRSVAGVEERPGHTRSWRLSEPADHEQRPSLADKGVLVRNPGSSLATASLFGEPVLRPLCGHDAFRDGSVKLVSNAGALADLEWLSRSALVLTCDSCSYLLWFADQDAVDLFEVGPHYQP